MKSRITKIIGFQTPTDGLTEEEEIIQKLIGNNAVENLYAKLPTNRMRFIVAAHIELGYSQELMASILGVSQGRIAQEISDIRSMFLGKNRRPSWRSFTANVDNYRPHKAKALTVDKLLKLAMYLQES